MRRLTVLFLVLILACFAAGAAADSFPDTYGVKFGMTPQEVSSIEGRNKRIGIVSDSEDPYQLFYNDGISLGSVSCRTLAYVFSGKEPVLKYYYYISTGSMADYSGIKNLLAIQYGDRLADAGSRKAFSDLFELYRSMSSPHEVSHWLVWDETVFGVDLWYDADGSVYTVFYDVDPSFDPAFSIEEEIIPGNGEAQDHAPEDESGKLVLFLSQGELYPGVPGKLSYTVRWDASVTAGPIKLVDENGQVLAYIGDLSEGTASGELEINEEKERFGSIHAECNDLRSSAVDFYVTNPVTSEMVDRIFDVGQDIRALIQSRYADDPYGTEAMAAIASQLSADSRVIRVYPYEDCVYFLTKDRLGGCYRDLSQKGDFVTNTASRQLPFDLTLAELNENTEEYLQNNPQPEARYDARLYADHEAADSIFSDPVQVFSDYLRDGFVRDHVFLKADKTMTNSRVLCIVPEDNDPIMKLQLLYYESLLQDYCAALNESSLLADDEKSTFTIVKGSEARRVLNDGDFTDYGIVILLAHGNYTAENNYFCCVASDPDEDTIKGLYKEYYTRFATNRTEWQRGRTGEGFGPYGHYDWRITACLDNNEYCLMVTYKYFVQVLADKSFDNTVVLLHSCHGLNDQKFSNLLLQHGADICYGTVENLSAGYGLSMFTGILENLSGISRTDHRYSLITDFCDDVFTIRNKSYPARDSMLRRAVPIYREDSNASIPFGTQMNLFEVNALVYHPALRASSELWSNHDPTYFAMRIAARNDQVDDYAVGDAQSIRGRVMFGTEERPFNGVSDAAVTVYRWMNHSFTQCYSGKTDPDGWYTVPLLSPGLYGIEASVPGYHGIAVCEVGAGQADMATVYLNNAILYYEYLRDQVVPWIRLVDDQPHSVASEALLPALMGSDSGLVSAAVCDLNGDGFMEMLTVTAASDGTHNYRLNLYGTPDTTGKIELLDSAEDVFRIESFYDEGRLSVHIQESELTKYIICDMDLFDQETEYRQSRIYRVDGNHFTDLTDFDGFVRGNSGVSLHKLHQKATALFFFRLDYDSFITEERNHLKEYLDNPNLAQAYIPKIMDLQRYITDQDLNREPVDGLVEEIEKGVCPILHIRTDQLIGHRTGYCYSTETGCSLTIVTNDSGIEYVQINDEGLFEEDFWSGETWDYLRSAPTQAMRDLYACVIRSPRLNLTAEERAALVNDPLTGEIYTFIGDHTNDNFGEYADRNSFCRLVSVGHARLRIMRVVDLGNHSNVRITLADEAAPVPAAAPLPVQAAPVLTAEPARIPAAEPAAVPAPTPEATPQSTPEPTPEPVAEPAAEQSVTFTVQTFASGQKLAVYSAPSQKAWRGANGKAAVSTNGEIWVCGQENGWLLVLYEVNSGKMRSGYIEISKVKGKVPNCPELCFDPKQAVLNASADLTDDPVYTSSKIATLKKGSKVTLLSSYENLAYVETKVKKKTVRGFLPLDCVDVQ